MLSARHVLRGAALLLPVVLVVVAISVPTIDVEVHAAHGIAPMSGAALMFLLPLALVLVGIASFAVLLWKKSSRPLSPHQQLIASLNAEEWRREFRPRPLKR